MQPAWLNRLRRRWIARSEYRTAILEAELQSLNWNIAESKRLDADLKQRRDAMVAAQADIEATQAALQAMQDELVSDTQSLREEIAAARREVESEREQRRAS